ncbi:MAG: tRNA (adenosine(37)-N6)-dimethylallyltransferase MiaA [Halanaerobiales bacterium]
MNNSLIVILGPTASGKTAVSIELAKKLKGEVISCDSMQIYKDMDVGTAKVSEEEMQGVPHYLLDIITPDKEFSVAEYQQRAYEYIDKIQNKQKTPLLVGGTGLYINSVVYGYQFSQEDIDFRLRNSLKRGLKRYGNGLYYLTLKKKCPDVAKKIHPNDTKRISRALEVYLQTGECLKTKKSENNPPDYDITLIGLKTDRNTLYQRINQRVDKMIESGLIEEVKYLLRKYDLSKVAKQAIGYKEVIDYLTGISTYDEMIRIIKRESRRYAKRQLTWFNRLDNIKWFFLDSKDEVEKISNEIYQYLQDNNN